MVGFTQTDFSRRRRVQREVTTAWWRSLLHSSSMRSQMSFGEAVQAGSGAEDHDRFAPNSGRSLDFHLIL